jgi:hypothetical protein
MDGDEVDALSSEEHLDCVSCSDSRRFRAMAVGEVGAKVTPAGLDRWRDCGWNFRGRWSLEFLRIDL